MHEYGTGKIGTFGATSCLPVSLPKDGLRRIAWPKVGSSGLLGGSCLEFGAIAILSAFLLALTGSLNTTIHLTSIEQFVTTAYGRTLFVKIELFVMIVGISAWHAFHVRPHLAQTLANQGEIKYRSDPVAASVTSAASAEHMFRPDAHATTTADRGLDGEEQASRDDTLLGDLSLKLEDWLRREALLGAGVLLCVALLAAFAGTLAVSAASSGTTQVPSGPYLHTQKTRGYAITLHVVPAKFGTNTFTVTVKDSKGQPVKDAIVVVTTNMLDMNMGEQNVALKPLGVNQPGVYSGQGDLTMAGHWKLIVKVVPPGTKQQLTTSFKLAIGYS